MNIRLFAGFVACILLFTAGCAGKNTPESDTSTSDTSTTTTTTTTTVPTTTTTARPMAVNPLTGVKDFEIGAPTRAVGVMLGNNVKGRPQHGINAADWFFETETEGGITRIMAVFASLDRMPNKVASIRSARTPFIMLAETLDLIYVHAGASRAGREALKARDLADVDALGNLGDTFWRDPELRQNKGFEHSLTTSGKNLKALASKRKYRTDSKIILPFSFEGNPAVGKAATKIEIKASGSRYVCFDYSAESGLYTKFNGKRENAEVHVDGDDMPIRVSNVIVMYDHRYAEDETTGAFDLVEGVGRIFTAGCTREIRWSRTTSALNFTETDGSPLAVSEGKTYFLLVNETYKRKTTSEP